MDTCKFYEGNRQLEPQEVRGLLPELSEKEIENYQEVKIDACDRETWSNYSNVFASGKWEVKAVTCTKCGGSAIYKTLGHLYDLTCPNCHTSESGTFYPGAVNCSTLNVQKSELHN